MKLYLSGIVEESIVDGPGVRYTIFSQGCAHNCKGCHNPQTHPFTAGGYWEDVETIVRAIKGNPLVKGVTFSGGDPLYQSKAFTELAENLKALGYDIWVYTGFLWEEVCANPIMSFIDVLVDGPFIEEQRTLDLRYRGSRNQRLIDVPKSLLAGHAVTM